VDLEEKNSLRCLSMACWKLAPVLILVLVTSSFAGSLARHNFQDETQPRYALSPSMTGSEMTGQDFSGQSATKPVEGALTLVVIAVEFSDKNSSRKIADLNMIFFHRLQKYLWEASYGQVMVEGKVAGLYHLPRSMASYGFDNGMIDGDVGGIRTHQLIQDAIAKADADIDFKNYDYLMIVHAGEGQETTPKAPDNIWSVTYLHGIWFRTNDEKSFSQAAIVPEKEGRGADVLGVIAHEFCHLLGLPDLYSSQKDALEGEAGRWELMARGLWNGDPPGSRPAHPTTWCKMELGWIKPSQVIGVYSGQSVTEYISPIESADRGLKAAKAPISDGEYYMIEYRSRFYDPFLPNEGLLIMKVAERMRSEGSFITVVCAHSKLDNATFKLGEYYLKQDHRILVSTRYASNDAYGIDVMRGEYRFLNVNVPHSDAPLLVDGKPCTPSSTGMTTVFVTPASHVIAVSKYMMKGCTRAVFEGWSDGVAENERVIQVGANVSLSVLYRSQALLSIASSGIPSFKYPSSIAVNGTTYMLHDLTRIDIWIDLSKVVGISILKDEVQIEQGIRYVFDGWEKMSLNSKTTYLVMTHPVELIVRFRKQYYLQVKSEFGNPAGEGWYDDGKKVRFRVTSPHYLSDRERCLFESWSGDCEGQGSTGEVVITKPHYLTAQWKRQHLTTFEILNFRGQPLSGVRPKVAVEAPNGTLMDILPIGESWMDEGIWTLRSIRLMGIDVSPTGRAFSPSKGGTWSIRARIFDLNIHISTSILMRGVPDAKVFLRSPDGRPLVADSSGNGYTTFPNLPIGEYMLDVVKDGQVVSGMKINLVQDTSLRIGIPDQFERALVLTLAVIGMASLTLVTAFVLVPRARRGRGKNSKRSLSALELVVRYYVIRHNGVISRSAAAKEFGISVRTLDLALKRLMSSGALRSR
jgi:M6 family metalloprotease-like protein